jgi:hypothetical protein
MSHSALLRPCKVPAKGTIRGGKLCGAAGAGDEFKRPMLNIASPVWGRGTQLLERSPRFFVWSQHSCVWRQNRRDTHRAGVVRARHATAAAPRHQCARTFVQLSRKICRHHRSPASIKIASGMRYSEYQATNSTEPTQCREQIRNSISDLRKYLRTKLVLRVSFLGCAAQCE